MKISSAASIAAACNVSLSYLATGKNTDAGVPDIEMLKPKVLNSPFHFSGLILLTRACQEFFDSMGRRPSLAEALTWISPNYINHLPLPDSRLVILPEGTPVPSGTN